MDNLGAYRMDESLKAQLQATLDMIPAFTWYAAPSGALLFVNSRCADYLGLPKDHQLRFGTDTGAAWDSPIPLLHPDDHEETRKLCSTCLQTGQAAQVRILVLQPVGVCHWFLIPAGPSRGADGAALVRIGINVDPQTRNQEQCH